MLPIYPPYDTLNNKERFTNFTIVQDHPLYLSKIKLPEQLCDTIVATYNTFGKDSFYHVGVNGTSDQTEGKGSFRVTNYDPEFAKYLTRLFVEQGEVVRIKLNELSSVNWQEDNPDKLSTWEFVGISPMFRYMEYTQGSEHFPHYDSPYYKDESPLLRTLMSGVLYLTTNKSGATGFIDDGQKDIPFIERDTSDWKQQATNQQTINWYLPTKGRMLFFPHQECHTVFPLQEDEKRIIIRFDFYFRAVK